VRVAPRSCIVHASPPPTPSRPAFRTFHQGRFTTALGGPRRHAGRRRGLDKKKGPRRARHASPASAYSGSVRWPGRSAARHAARDDDTARKHSAAGTLPTGGLASPDPRARVSTVGLGLTTIRTTCSPDGRTLRLLPSRRLVAQRGHELSTPLTVDGPTDSCTVAIIAGPDCLGSTEKLVTRAVRAKESSSRPGAPTRGCGAICAYDRSNQRERAEHGEQLDWRTSRGPCVAARSLQPPARGMPRARGPSAARLSTAADPHGKPRPDRGPFVDQTCIDNAVSNLTAMAED